MEDRVLKEAVHCTATEISKLFGLGVRRIGQLQSDGVIGAEKAKGKGGKRYNLEDTVKRYVSYLSDKAYGKEKKDIEVKLREQKLKADIKLKESQGELHELKTLIAAGKFIAVEDVKRDYANFFVNFKKFALAIPSNVAGRINGAVEPMEVRRIESELVEEITELLRGFVLSTEVGKCEEVKEE